MIYNPGQIYRSNMNLSQDSIRENDYLLLVSVQHCELPGLSTMKLKFISLATMRDFIFREYYVKVFFTKILTK